MQFIIDAIGTMIDFVVNMFQSIIWFVTNLPAMLEILQSSYVYAPPFVQSFLLLSIAATALFAVIRLI